MANSIADSVAAEMQARLNSPAFAELFGKSAAEKCKHCHCSPCECSKADDSAKYPHEQGKSSPAKADDAAASDGGVSGSGAAGAHKVKPMHALYEGQPAPKVEENHGMYPKTDKDTGNKC